jgi:hypothetical protein
MTPLAAHARPRCVYKPRQTRANCNINAATMGLFVLVCLPPGPDQRVKPTDFACPHDAAANLAPPTHPVLLIDVYPCVIPSLFLPLVA